MFTCLVAVKLVHRTDDTYTDNVLLHLALPCGNQTHSYAGTHT